MSMEESKSTAICAVPGCKDYLKDGIKMHKCPKGVWKQIWLIAINASHKVRESKSIFVCSSHFTDTDYRRDKTNPNIKNLKSTAVPTLNLNIVDENIVIDDTDSSSRDIVYDTQNNIKLNNNNKASTILKIDLPRMCRVCLKNDSKTYNIYSKFNKEDEFSKTIAEIIMIFTNIMIVENDKFPKDICGFCLSDLQRAYCFKSNCEKSNKLLIDYAKDFMNESCELPIIPKTYAAELLKEKIKQNILSYIKFQSSATEIKYKENMLSETVVDLSKEIDNNKHEELEAKCDSHTDTDSCSIASDNFIVDDSDDYSDDDSNDDFNDDSNDDYLSDSYDKVKCNGRNECHNYKRKLRPKSYRKHIDYDSNDDGSVHSNEEIKNNEETECHNYKRKLRQTSFNNNQASNVSEICDTPSNNIISEQSTEEPDYFIPSKRVCTNSVASSENLVPDTPIISTKDDSNDKHNSTSTSSSAHNDFLKILQQPTTTTQDFQETTTDSTKNTSCENASISKNGEEIVNNAANNSNINLDKSQNIELSVIPTVPFNIARESIAPVDIQVSGDTSVANRNAIPQYNSVCYPNKTNQVPARLPNTFENQSAIPQYNQIATAVTKNTLPQNKKKSVKRAVDTISSNQNLFFYPDCLIPSKRLCTNSEAVFENLLPDTPTLSIEQDLSDKHISSSTPSSTNNTPDCNSIPEQCTDEVDSLITPNAELSSNQILNRLLVNGRTNSERVLYDKHKGMSTSSFSNIEFLNELQESTTTTINLGETVDSTENINCENEEINAVNNDTNSLSIDIEKSRKFTNIGINYFSTVSSDIPTESSIPVDIQELEDTLAESHNGISQCNPIATVKNPLPVSSATKRHEVLLDSFYFENQNTIPQYNPIATVITENTLPQNKIKSINRGIRGRPKNNVKTNRSIALTRGTILSNQSRVNTASTGVTYNRAKSTVTRTDYNNFNIQFKQFAMASGSTVNNNTGLTNNAQQTESQKHMSIIQNYLQNDKIQKQGVINWQIANASRRFPFYNDCITHQSSLSGTIDSEYIQLPNPVSLQTPNNTLIVPQYNSNYYVIQNDGDRNLSNVPGFVTTNMNNAVPDEVNVQAFPANELPSTNYMHGHIINQQNRQIMNLYSSSPNASSVVSTANSTPFVNNDTSTTNSMFVNFTANNSTNNIVNNTVSNIAGFIKVKNLSELL